MDPILMATLASERHADLLREAEAWRRRAAVRSSGRTRGRTGPTDASRLLSWATTLVGGRGAAGASQPVACCA